MKNIFIILLSVFMVSCASTEIKTKIQPVEFVKQILEPTGGEVSKPKSWFYAERHKAANSLNWIISKEDPQNGYETGLSIQFMMGINKGTGLMPEEYVQGYIEHILKTSTLIKRCDTSKVGDFIRSCMEVTQVQMRDGIPINFTILYSFLWDNKKDSVGLTVAGSPTAEWPKYSNTFNQMTEIKLIDPSRFK
jgi:hypothetical protein